MIHLEDNMRLNESIFKSLNSITPIASHSESKHTTSFGCSKNLITSLIKSSDHSVLFYPFSIHVSCVFHIYTNMKCSYFPQKFPLNLEHLQLQKFRRLEKDDVIQRTVHNSNTTYNRTLLADYKKK